MCMNGIFYVLNQIGIPNIGLSIIIMTILIYMAMLPLTIKQQKFSKLQRKNMKTAKIPSLCRDNRMRSKRFMASTAFPRQAAACS